MREELNTTEVLNFILENAMINMSDVQDQIEMSKQKEILQQHKYSIWYSENEDCWYTNVPNDLQPGKFKKIKRKKKADLEKAICQYYQDQGFLAPDNDKIMTVEELFHEFMEYKKSKVEGGTVKRMMSDWQKFYLPHPELTQKKITEVTKIDIDNFFNALLSESQFKKKSFHNMCGIIKQAFEYAIDADYLEKSPYRVKINVKRLLTDEKKPSHKEVYQTGEKERLLDEMERRLRNKPSNTAPLAIMLDFELGTRKGETLALRLSDIVGNRIHIQRQQIYDFDVSDLNKIVRTGYPIVDYTKSADGDRWLPLSKNAKAIIQRVIAINKEYGHACEDFLFVRDNHVLTPASIDAQMKHGCKYIGLPLKSMHKIRKTYASTLLHNGVNLSIVKDMLGHADEATTLAHYIFNTEDRESTDRTVLNALEGNSCK